MPATVTWISVAPVKGLRLVQREEVLLTEDGVPGDRAFFVVDGDRGAMVSATRLGPLVAVVAEHDDGRLALRFPDGGSVEAEVRLGEPEPIRFGRLALTARPVQGPFADALSDHCGKSLRLFAAPPERIAVDRGRAGATTLLSVASLERLREQAGSTEPIDPRRFRMTFGIGGLEPHHEDRWIGSHVTIGETVVRVLGNVGRCALTTRQPDTGVVDFKALHHLNAYRGSIETTEPLPFGVFATVIRPGRVRLGDAVEYPGWDSNPQRS